jgi:hypothetical protein
MKLIGIPCSRCGRIAEVSSYYSVVDEYDHFDAHCKACGKRGNVFGERSIESSLKNFYIIDELGFIIFYWEIEE